VAELCIKSGQPTPYQVLCDCLKRSGLHCNLFVTYVCECFYGCGKICIYTLWFKNLPVIHMTIVSTVVDRFL